MTSKEEQAYITGQRMCWRKLLGECIRELGDDAPDGARSLLVLTELKQVLATIREDVEGDWPDDLHPADVLSKHIAPLLRQLMDHRESTWERGERE